MEFLFFDAAGVRLFSRNDAESATWTVEEMNLQALFPYDPGKVIQRGQRIGFRDELGVFQPFEIRKVRSYEPDHYQEITAEHIAISELSDEHLKKAEITDETAASALGDMLTGTLWSVGNDTSDGSTSSGDVSMGSVWQGVRTIENNWNVYITPRVTMNAAGITGRYLDIAPAAPVWRGIRLSLDKNADELGVTWDDTNVITAIYGYGGRVADSSGDDTEVLTFKDEVWTATADHPAKPAGQEYLEDPTAKALYGRNGRNRFGYYQNSSIDDAEVLLEKSWEALKNSNEPEVSIDCTVRDLYRLGYADQPIALHDLAIIDVRPTGEVLQREIIRLDVDLLDPTATRVTIGAYIPNIIYIQRDTEKAAKGGGGGGGRGGGGGGGGEDNQIYEFETQIQANQYQINLRAWQRDLDHTDENLLLAYAALGITSNSISSIVTSSGVQLNPDGSIKTDENGNPVFNGTTTPGVWSSIKQTADRVALVVDGNGIRAAQITAAINNDGSSSVYISADKITLAGGQTTVESLLTGASNITSLKATAFQQTTGNLYLKNHLCNWSAVTYVKSVSITMPTITRSAEHPFMYGSLSATDGVVTGRIITAYSSGSSSVSTETKYFLLQEDE